jgi:excisionase family DNA binding protein
MLSEGMDFRHEISVLRGLHPTPFICYSIAWFDLMRVSARLCALMLVPARSLMPPMTHALPIYTDISLMPGGGADELLTVAEAAACLRVSRATLWRWCQEGRVPALKIGREWRILLGPVLHRLVAEEGGVQRAPEPEAALPCAPVP